MTVPAESLVEYDLELRPFARVGAVAEIAVGLDLTIYDASYVSLAAAVDGRAYTADEKLLSTVSGTEFADRLAHVADYR